MEGRDVTRVPPALLFFLLKQLFKTVASFIRSKTMARGRVRVLTVGDGDLSYSLALARCFNDGISLTATTLPSREELLGTYERAAAIIAELEACGATVLHGVNAASLEAAVPELEPQEHIMFAHPHLGLSDLHEKEAHAQRHRGVLSLTRPISPICQSPFFPYLTFQLFFECSSRTS